MKIGGWGGGEEGGLCGRFIDFLTHVQHLGQGKAKWRTEKLPMAIKERPFGSQIDKKMLFVPSTAACTN
jgi:hypothetical protein